MHWLASRAFLVGIALFAVGTTLALRRPSGDSASVESQGVLAPAKVWHIAAILFTWSTILLVGFVILEFGPVVPARLEVVGALSAFAVASLFGIPAWILSKKVLRMIFGNR